MSQTKAILDDIVLMMNQPKLQHLTTFVDEPNKYNARQQLLMMNQSKYHDQTTFVDEPTKNTIVYNIWWWTKQRQNQTTFVDEPTEKHLLMSQTKILSGKSSLCEPKRILTVVVGGSKCMLCHAPAGREDDKVSNGNTRFCWGTGEHSEDTGILQSNWDSLT